MEVTAIKALTQQKMRGGKERSLVVSGLVRQTKQNGTLADGNPRTIFFKGHHRKALLMSNLAQGDLVNLLYEGKITNNPKYPNGLHQLSLRTFQTPNSRPPFQDPLGI